jgi:flagellar hook-basal body complex protein FliE
MAIENISAAARFAEIALPERPGAAPASEFGAWLQGELAAVNRKIVESDAQVRELAAGGDVQLHDVMLSLEDAKLSFELLLAIRNKALEAYQELMRMQI